MPEPLQPRSAAPAPPPNPLEQVQRERAVLLRFVRMIFFILMVTVAMLLVLQQGDIANIPESSTTRVPARSHATAPGATAPGDGATADAEHPTQTAPTVRNQAQPLTGVQSPEFTLAVNWYAVLAVAVAFFCIVVLVDMLTPNKKIAAVSGVFLGMLTGILATIALSFIIDLVVRTWIPSERWLEANRPIFATIKVMLGISLCYLGISTVMQTQDQFRLVIPYVEFTKQLRGVRPNLLDTSALIDARIVEVGATHLLQSPLVVPRFVIAELQLMADSSDKLKRARGRRGLDVVTRLQRLGTLDVLIDETPVDAIGVDQMLVELASRLGARIVTTDLGLTRVAQIKGLTAINLHDLANAMRPALVPGEHISIRLVKPGEQPGQGVGYLDDGTMVVAEGGSPFIGHDVGLLVTSTMQTTAGRLVFARPLEPAGEPTASAHPAAAAKDDGAASHPMHEGAVENGSPAAETSAVPGPRPNPIAAKPPPPRRPSAGASARNPRRWPPAND